MRSLRSSSPRRESRGRYFPLSVISNHGPISVKALGTAMGEASSGAGRLLKARRSYASYAAAMRDIIVELG